jgi:hypothetical protein
VRFRLLPTALCALVVASDASLPARAEGAQFGVERQAMEDARVSGETTIRDESRAAVATIKPLVAAGVPPEAVDKDGRTALYEAGSYDAVVALLAAGARADMVDRNGRSPALVQWDDRAIVALLGAGASPSGRGGDGKTLRERAAGAPMPATLAWLDAHKVK